MARNFVLTTFGSLGDLHPYIAVGKGLRARGHAVTIATSEIYRAKVEGEGLGFRPVRPDLAGLLGNPEVMRKAFHPYTGTRYIVRDLFVPFVEQACEDTLIAARDADLIVGHALAFAVPLVAEVTKKRWISVALAPSLMLSACDPPAMPGPFAEFWRRRGPRFHALVLNSIRRTVRRYGAPIAALRAKLGLEARENPIVDDMFSPWGTQAWFSGVLASPQPDWPTRTQITGFPFYDRLGPTAEVNEGLRRFVEAGPAPVVFTLGSSAVSDAGNFYVESARAASLAGCRAVLLTGSDARNRAARALPDSIYATEYAPYSELLPYAAATVHQGGIGTTAQALRSGRPMIVVPWSHDQPDNAQRATRLGVARTVPRSKYRAERVARELRMLLNTESYGVAATRAAEAIAGEDGVRAACDGLEAVLRVSR